MIAEDYQDTTSDSIPKASRYLLRKYSSGSSNGLVMTRSSSVGRSRVHRVSGHILEKSTIVRCSSLSLDLNDWKMFLTSSKSSAKTTTGSSRM